VYPVGGGLIHIILASPAIHPAVALAAPGLPFAKVRQKCSFQYWNDRIEARTVR